jgi:hypothetical protein
MAFERELADLIALALVAEFDHLQLYGLKPDRYEERFEKVFGAAGLTVSAQADRLDRNGKLAHVADYKSHAGRTGYAKSAKLDPEVLQVSVYLNLMAPEADPMFSVVHMGTGMRPPVQPIRAEAENARQLVSDAIVLAEGLANAWVNLQAAPWPDGLLSRKSDWEPECKYCDFRSVCRGDHAPTRSRLASSLELKTLRDLLPSTPSPASREKGG